jgi:RNA polymerase sigma factor (sigma-70 family)
MTDERKLQIISEFEPLIHKLAYSYKIFGFTKQELMQEIKTHICAKLEDFNSTKGSLPYFVELVVRNKLNNLYKSPYNEKEVLKPKIYRKEKIEDYSLAEKRALEVAHDLLVKEKHKDLIFDVLKGKPLRYVGDKYKVSHQTVNNIYKEFIDKVKKEL